MNLVTPRQTDEQGFTLLEVVIVVALGSAIVILLGMVLLSSQGLSSDIQVATRGATHMSRVLDTIAPHLMSGAQVVAFNDTSLLVQEPVDGDGDGDFVDADGNVQLGAEGVFGWAYEYVWISAGSRVEESALAVDLNGDGDATDGFDAGSIVLRVVDGGGFELGRRTIAGGASVLRDPTNTELQPLFAMPFADTVEINVFTPVISTSQGKSHAQLFRGRRLVTMR